MPSVIAPHCGRHRILPFVLSTQSKQSTGNCKKKWFFALENGGMSHILEM
jgi:hypothetical protein